MAAVQAVAEAAVSANGATSECHCDALAGAATKLKTSMGVATEAQPDIVRCPSCVLL